MSRRTRILLGLFGAPLAPQLVIAWISITHNFVGHVDRFFIVETLVYSYFLTLTAGLVTHLILKRQRRYGRQAYAITGAMTGVVAGMLFVLALQVVAPRLDLTSSMLVALGVMGGALTVIISNCFWFIARPDKP